LTSQQFTVQVGRKGGCSGQPVLLRACRPSSRGSKLHLTPQHAIGFLQAGQAFGRQKTAAPCAASAYHCLCAIIVAVVLQVGAASDHDLVLLQGQLEAARAEAVSASRQWAAERQQLVASAQSMWAELQRCHEALAQTVGQVGACCRQRVRRVWHPACCSQDRRAHVRCSACRISCMLL
jgi:hypothetical protein